MGLDKSSLRGSKEDELYFILGAKTLNGSNVKCRPRVALTASWQTTAPQVEWPTDRTFPDNA